MGKIQDILVESKHDSSIDKETSYEADRQFEILYDIGKGLSSFYKLIDQDSTKFKSSKIVSDAYGKGSDLYFHKQQMVKRLKSLKVTIDEFIKELE